VIFHRLGRWNEAVDAITQAAALAPNDPSLATILGVALQDAGRFDESAAVLWKATAKWPDEPTLRHQTRQAVQAVVPFWHIPMMKTRRAIPLSIGQSGAAVAAVGPSARVLDIGRAAASCR